MKAVSSFSNILAAAGKAWCRRKGDESVISIAIPISGIDPLQQLPLLKGKESFRFLWDKSPGLSIAASGLSQQLNLVGERRFELAQRFSDTTLGHLTDATPEAPAQARPRILFAFSFFESTTERKRDGGDPPAVQAVLPRWQLSRKGAHGWLRLNGVVTHEAEVRELAEQLWLMSERLSKTNKFNQSIPKDKFQGSFIAQEWQDCYRPALSRGIDLVNSGELQKLVLAVRQSIQLDSSLNPLELLEKLRYEQESSCRFLWQHNKDEAFFGASPERLISIRNGQLFSDALAGTAGYGASSDCLLKSAKDRREHEIVVTSIIDQLSKQGIHGKRPKTPELAKHGQLLHLHTLITADARGHRPLQLANSLHPTPAVAGLPRKEALNWLRTLEPFERGNYAAPIGWIDIEGNAELRVAIRCGKTNGQILELTAGAGLVRGSIPDKELEEVGLKLAVLADQLQLTPNLQVQPFNKEAIT